MVSFNITQPEQADSFLASCLVQNQVHTSISCLQLSQSWSQQELFLLHVQNEMFILSNKSESPSEVL